MKLTYIVNSRIPTEKAHGYQICKMCEEFSSAGVNVELVIPNRLNIIEEDVFSFYGFKKNFEVRNIDIIDFFKWRKFFGSRICFYISSLLFFAKLLFLKIENNSIIYTRDVFITFIFSIRGYTTVYECHDWFSKSKFLSLFLLKKCNFIITTNRYIKEQFEKNNFKTVLVAPNGVDIDLFDIKINREEAIKKISLEEKTKKELTGGKLLMYTGSFTTMHQDKGIDDIFRALKIINDKNIIFCAVGGSDKDIKYYNEIAMNMSLPAKVFLFGKKTQRELALFQKIADILLMPFPKKAHYEYFMAPLKMFEYMASKKPIIASKLPSILEVLDEKNSFLVSSGNPENLAQEIMYVLKNVDEANSRADLAFRKVSELYTWRERTKNILSFIKK